MRFFLVLALAACHPPIRRPTTGGIAGYVRDQTSGTPIAGATLAAHGNDSLHVHSTRSARDGSYEIDGLPPSGYGLLVVVPGQSLHYTDIPVSAGHVTGFDVPVDPGNLDGTPVPYAKVEGGEIRTYRAADLAATAGRIEGTVTDSVTRERTPGAVITATSPAAPDVITVVADDRGEYRIDDVPPGTYTLSAFYQVAARGQIEVIRSDVAVAGGQATVVPMFIEVTGGQ